MEKKYNIKIGVVSVDSGLCWLGDPCYIHNNHIYERSTKIKQKSPKDWGKNWKEFVNNLYKKTDEEIQIAQFNHDLGHAGLGVCFQTNGDGVYPVFAEITEYNNNKKISKVWVDFTYYDNA